MMDIQILGTGGGMPMPFRGLSSVVVGIGGRKILIDCGEGSQVIMREVSSGFKNIDCILITHCHGDHINGLNGLLGTIGNSGRENPIRIIGPKGIEEVVIGLMTTCKYLPYSVDIVEENERMIFTKRKNMIIPSNEGEIEIKTIKLEHSTDCIGYSIYLKRRRAFQKNRAIELGIPIKYWNSLINGESIFDNGKIYKPDMVLGNERKGIKLSYITDSRPLDYIAEFIYKSDLFICEGTYGDDLDINKAKRNKHMTFREAATLARKGEVNKLLITHFSPALCDPLEYKENALEEFQSSIIAKDKMRLSLNFPIEN